MLMKLSSAQSRECRKEEEKIAQAGKNHLVHIINTESQSSPIHC